MTRWTELTDPGARKALAAYFSKVDRALAPLPDAEAQEIRTELEMHVLDRMAVSGSADEAHAREALNRLGEPHAFLPTLVADRLRARAARTLRPGHVLAALLRSATSGAIGLLISTLVGLGYAIAALDIVLGIADIFMPDIVGLFWLDSGGLFLGIDTKVQGHDIFGGWFAPLAIGLGVGIYVVLTWAFGLNTAQGRSRIAQEDGAKMYGHGKI